MHKITSESWKKIAELLTIRSINKLLDENLPQFRQGLDKVDLTLISKVVEIGVDKFPTLTTVSIEERKHKSTEIDNIMKQIPKQITIYKNMIYLDGMFLISCIYVPEGAVKYHSDIIQSIPDSLIELECSYLYACISSSNLVKLTVTILNDSLIGMLPPTLEYLCVESIVDCQKQLPHHVIEFHDKHVDDAQALEKVLHPHLKVLKCFMIGISEHEITLPSSLNVVIFYTNKWVPIIPDTVKEFYFETMQLEEDMLSRFSLKLDKLSIRCNSINDYVLENIRPARLCTRVAVLSCTNNVIYKIARNCGYNITKSGNVALFEK